MIDLGFDYHQSGVRQLETDDLIAEDLKVIQFVLVVGGGGSSSCVPSSTTNLQENSAVNEGSVVLEASTDGGLSWTLLQELLASEYRDPK